MKIFFKKLLYTFTVTLVFVYGIYTMIEQEVELKNIADEKEKYVTLCENEEMRHEQLLETKKNINSDEYIEEVAREKLGLVMPYEIIFVDASIWKDDLIGHPFCVEATTALRGLFVDYIGKMM